MDALLGADGDFDATMKAFQDRLQQYKYMELSKRQQLGSLRVKIPDIEKNLDIIGHLRQRDDEAPLEVNYELNDTLYTRATVDASTQLVYLWLGAEVMLEYSLDEAVALLQERLANNLELLAVVKEDLDFLKENITTMEVNTARLYNWDVERRKRARQQETA